MKLLVYSMMISTLMIASCVNKNQKNEVEKFKVEILRTENNFAKMTAEEGVTRAFLFYASDDAVVNRANTLIKGKANLKKYLESQPFTRVKLKWTPDFVDVSASGDLGYTYGQFYFSALDTAGKVVNFNGPFHTVWKKQKDGTWRFVWD